MIQITQMLTILGEHFPLVLVGGAEALVAIVLVGKTRMRGGGTGKKRKKTDPEQILLDTLEKRKQEVPLYWKIPRREKKYGKNTVHGTAGKISRRRCS